MDFLHHVVQHFGRVVAAAGRAGTAGARFEVVDEVAEIAQWPQLAVRQLGLDAAFKDGLEQRTLPLARERAQHLQGRLPHAAARRRHGANKRRVVVFVGQQAQIADDVLDFGLVEETLAARNRVGNAFLAQALLDDARLVVAPVQNGVIGKFVLALEMVGRDHDGHLLRLLLVRLHAQHLDRFAQAMFRPQRLFKQFRIVANHGVGRIEHAHGGAVILLQFDHAQVGEVRFQGLQIFHGGAAPGINGLVVVAHGRKHRLLADARHHQFHQFVLAGVRILVFVDEQIAQTALPLVAYGSVVAEQFHG